MGERCDEGRRVDEADGGWRIGAGGASEQHLKGINNTLADGLTRSDPSLSTEELTNRKPYVNSQKHALGEKEKSSCIRFCARNRSRTHCAIISKTL